MTVSLYVLLPLHCTTSVKTVKFLMGTLSVAVKLKKKEQKELLQTQEEAIMESHDTKKNEEDTEFLKKHPEFEHFLGDL